MKRTNKEYMKIRITRETEKQFRRAKELFPEFAETNPFYKIKWQKKGQSAGSCKMICAKINEATLTFHYPLIADYPEELSQIVIHELCHFIANNIKRSSQNHNAFWKTCMRKMGVQPDIYHALDVSTYKRKMKKYVFTCPQCGFTYYISPIKYKRIREGYVRILCGKCSKHLPLKPTGEIVYK